MGRAFYRNENEMQYSTSDLLLWLYCFIAPEVYVLFCFHWISSFFSFKCQGAFFKLPVCSGRILSTSFVLPTLDLSVASFALEKMATTITSTCFLSKHKNLSKTWPPP